MNEGAEQCREHAARDGSAEQIRSTATRRAPKGKVTGEWRQTTPQSAAHGDKQATHRWVPPFACRAAARRCGRSAKRAAWRPRPCTASPRPFSAKARKGHKQTRPEVRARKENADRQNARRGSTESAQTHARKWGNTAGSRELQPAAQELPERRCTRQKERSP